MKKVTNIDIITYLDFLTLLNPSQSLQKFEINNGGVKIEATIPSNTPAGFKFVKYSFDTHPLGGYVAMFTDGDGKISDISNLFDEYMGVSSAPQTESPEQSL